MALQMNWFKRYINDYEYWTKKFDNIFKVTTQNRKIILNYGSEYLSPLIQHLKYDNIRNILKNLQIFLQECSTNLESWDNHYMADQQIYKLL